MSEKEQIKDIINNPELFSFCVKEKGAMWMAEAVYGFILEDWN